MRRPAARRHDFHLQAKSELHLLQNHSAEHRRSSEFCAGTAPFVFFPPNRLRCPYETFKHSRYVCAEALGS